MELKTRDIGGIPVNASKMEINGQIHNIKQLHNKLHYMWDNMTFDELVSESPTLNNIIRSLPPKFKNQWIRDLKTRMHREGLLGKMMAN